MTNKNRIQYKNIYCEYNLKSFDGVVNLQDIKAFFIELFKNKFKSNSIKYLLISYDNCKKNNKILILLQLENKPDWTNVNNFIYQNILPQVSNCLSPFETHEELTKNLYVCHGNSDFILDVSNKSHKDQYKFFMNVTRQLRDEKETREKNKDDLMTFEEAEKRILKYLRDTKNYLEFEDEKVNKILISWFATPINNLLDNTIKDLDSFIPFNEITNLKNDIKKQIEKLRNNDRTCFINVYGASGIGKTQLIKSILKYFNIKFNYILGKIRFEKGIYDDDAEVDILDDSDFFKWKQNAEGIDYVKMVVGCNQKGAQGYGNKFCKFFNLNKNKLSIIVCNPGIKSFYNWATHDGNVDKDYIKERQGIYVNLGSEKLYLNTKKNENNND